MGYHLLKSLYFVIYGIGNIEENIENNQILVFSRKERGGNKPNSKIIESPESKKPIFIIKVYVEIVTLCILLFMFFMFFVNTELHI